jgi:hypothetical protein
MKKLLDAKREIGKVAKNAKNPHFKNTYADVNALLEAVEPILHTHGLLLLQPIIEGEVVTQIIDVESGQVIESSLPLPSNVTAQQMGSFVSYFRRYTLQSLLSLQTTEDDDGNKASTPPPPPPKPQQTLAPLEVEVIEAIKDFKTKAELKYYLGTLSEMEKTPAVQEFAKTHYKTLN